MRSPSSTLLTAIRCHCSHTLLSTILIVWLRTTGQNKIKIVTVPEFISSFAEGQFGLVSEHVYCRLVCCNPLFTCLNFNIYCLWLCSCGQKNDNNTGNNNNTTVYSCNSFTDDFKEWIAATADGMLFFETGLTSECDSRIREHSESVDEV